MIVVALRVLFTATLFCILTCGVCGEGSGWRMVDRFFGFRFEIQGVGLEPTLQTDIQDQADRQGCFGWVQKYHDNGHVVGEVRCSKQRGMKMRDWLSTVSGIGLTRTMVTLNSVCCRL